MSKINKVKKKLETARNALGDLRQYNKRAKKSEASAQDRIDAIRKHKQEPGTSSLVPEQCVQLVAGFEGFSDHAYKPVAAEQYWTIGYGHYGPDVHPGATISKTDAQALLRKDLEVFAKGVDSLVKVNLNDNQRSCLISFAYNIGLGAFGSSTLLKLLNQGDYASVPDQLLRWVNGASGPLAGLVTRRKAEGALFSKKLK